MHATDVLTTFRFLFLFSHFEYLLCSVGFYQMAKISVTPTIVLAEFILLKKTVSFKKVSILNFPISFTSWITSPSGTISNRRVRD